MDLIYLGIIVLISGVISAMGIGGGGIFIIISTILGMFAQKEAQGYNLIMFIAVGISATISNIINKNFDKKIFFKLIVFVIIGSLIGTNIAKNISEEQIKLYFYLFMLALGLFESFKAIKAIIKSKREVGERSE